MLKTKKVGKYTLSQAGMIHAVRRINMLKEIQAKAEGMDEETLTALAVYPHIAACAEPKITLDEFMQMPEQQLDKLTQAVMELNPHWFELPDQEKKTETQPTESTPPSET